MSRLDALYQQLILDHNKFPRHFGKIDGYTHYSHGVNPLCGDDYEVTLVINSGVVTDAQFCGTGCAISKASGSLMTSSVIGQSVDTVLGIKELFFKMILTDELSDNDRQALGKLAALEGVKKFPARVKCAALVWRAIEDALSKSTAQIVSTE